MSESDSEHNENVEMEVDSPEKQDEGFTHQESDEKNVAKTSGGLLDRPIIQYGQRERKKTERLEMKVAPSKERSTEEQEGSGDKLGDSPSIEFNLSKIKADDLKPFHRLLYNRPGTAHEIKKNIKKFCGYTFSSGSPNYLKKKTNVEKLPLQGIKNICAIVEVERNGTKDEVITRLLDFLCEPKVSTDPVKASKAHKSSSKSRKASKPKTPLSRSTPRQSKKAIIDHGSSAEEDLDSDEAEGRKKSRSKKVQKKSDSDFEDELKTENSNSTPVRSTLRKVKKPIVDHNSSEESKSESEFLTESSSKSRKVSKLKTPSSRSTPRQAKKAIVDHGSSAEEDLDSEDAEGRKKSRSKKVQKKSDSDFEDELKTENSNSAPVRSTFRKVKKPVVDRNSSEEGNSESDSDTKVKPKKSANAKKETNKSTRKQEETFTSSSRKVKKPIIDRGSSAEDEEQSDQSDSDVESSVRKNKKNDIKKRQTKVSKAKKKSSAEENSESEGENKKVARSRSSRKVKRPIIDRGSSVAEDSDEGDVPKRKSHKVAKNSSGSEYVSEDEYSAKKKVHTKISSSRKKSKATVPDYSSDDYSEGDSKFTPVKKSKNTKTNAKNPTDLGSMKKSKPTVEGSSDEVSEDNLSANKDAENELNKSEQVEDESSDATYEVEKVSCDKKAKSKKTESKPKKSKTESSDDEETQKDKSVKSNETKLNSDSSHDSTDEEESKPKDGKKNSALKEPKKGTITSDNEAGHSDSVKKEKTNDQKKRRRSNSDNEESSDDEPLVKKKKPLVPPTNDELEATIKKILKGADLEEITMSSVYKQVCSKYPEFDLKARKDFIKTTVRSIL